MDPMLPFPSPKQPLATCKLPDEHMDLHEMQASISLLPSGIRLPEFCFSPAQVWACSLWPGLAMKLWIGERTKAYQVGCLQALWRHQLLSNTFQMHHRG